MGWTPVPVASKSKRPLGEGWQERRWSEAEILDAFAGDGNIGLLTGEPSRNLVEVDLDSAEAIALADSFLPQTSMVSGHGVRRRSHRWFRIVDDVPRSLALKDIGKDGEMLVELRADGHQTLVPPSIHPNGDAYEWEGNLEPAEVRGAELLRFVRRLGAASLLARHWPTVNGSRHDISNALAGTLLRAGWSTKDASEFISAVARCVGDEEARARSRDVVDTAKRLRNGGAATGRPVLEQLLGVDVVSRLADWLGLSDGVAGSPAQPWEPPVTFTSPRLPEFPAECLPAWVKDFVSELAVATQTPVALGAGLTLSVIAVAAARRIRVEIRRGWTEPVNIFTATSMPPGNRKTAVFGAVMAPLIRHESREAARLKPLIQEQEGRRRILAKALKDAEKAAAKMALKGSDEGMETVHRLRQELAEVVVPLPPRHFTDDATPEALSMRMAQHGGRFAVLSAEGGVFELMAGRYNSTNSPNFDVFLKGHAGDPLRVDRVQRGHEVVDLPALTIGLAFQPDVLRNLATKPGFRGRGLLGRILYALPTSLVGNRQIGADPVSEAVARAFQQKILSLLASIPEPLDAANAPCMRLSDAADEAMADFERWLEPRLAPDALLGTIADWASKLAGAAARIAGLLHLARYGDSQLAVETRIGVDTIAEAIEIAKFYLSHARAAFAQMGADPEVERAKLVLGWVSRKGLTSFSARDAFQALKGRVDKAAEVKTALDLLVEHGYLRQIVTEGRRGPGRPASEKFEVNPLWDRNSEDIEDIEEINQKSNLDQVQSISTSSSSQFISIRPSQNSHNPQNSHPAADEIEL